MKDSFEVDMTSEDGSNKGKGDNEQDYLSCDDGSIKGDDKKENRDKIPVSKSNCICQLVVGIAATTVASESNPNKTRADDPSAEIS